MNQMNMIFIDFSMIFYAEMSSKTIQKQCRKRKRKVAKIMDFGNLSQQRNGKRVHLFAGFDLFSQGSAAGIRRDALAMKLAEPP